MMKKWKKYCSIVLIISSAVLAVSCGLTGKKPVMPKSNGNCQEKIEYHRKEIQKHQANIEREERRSQRALSRQDLDTARAAQNRKMQYQKKIDQHATEMDKLRSSNENG